MDYAWLPSYMEINELLEFLTTRFTSRLRSTILVANFVSKASLKCFAFLVIIDFLCFEPDKFSFLGSNTMISSSIMEKLLYLSTALAGLT